MVIAVDETGSFRAGKGLNYGLTVLVTVTDSTWGDFVKYADGLFPSGWKNVKGKTVGEKEREELIKFIGKRDEFKYVAHLYDLGFGEDSVVKEHQAIQKAKFLGQKARPSMQKELQMLHNQLGNLSVSDYSKFILIFELFVEWQRFFQFDYVYTHPSRDSWVLWHTVDTQNKPDKFKDLIKKMLILTTSNLNPNYGIFSPAEWKREHPFNERHCLDGDVTKQSGRIFFENFKIGNEQNDPCLILPDLIGHTIHKSISNRNEKRWLRLLKRLRNNRSLTMTNKRTGKPEQYYLVRGFDKNRDSGGVAEEIKEHYRSMRDLS
ncbi:hypothetical protein HYU90_00415 [Candidatus Collierbacteria bacterium]|nr:hypothetical protein [Candidatus Collierbacteria bacterium]